MQLNLNDAVFTLSLLVTFLTSLLSWLKARQNGTAIGVAAESADLAKHAAVRAVVQNSEAIQVIHCQSNDRLTQLIAAATKAAYLQGHADSAAGQPPAPPAPPAPPGPDHACPECPGGPTCAACPDGPGN